MAKTTTAKFENFVLNHRSGNQSVAVNSSERVCVNCIWYEQYFRQNRGNVYGWTPTSTGYCIFNECMRGPLRQPCKYFERRDQNAK